MTGSTVTFTIVVTNNGPVAATNAQLTDLLPAGLTYVSSTASQGTYTPGSGLWTIGGLGTTSPSNQATLTINATIN